VNAAAPSLPVTVVWAVVAAIVICVGWRLNEQLLPRLRLGIAAPRPRPRLLGRSCRKPHAYGRRPAFRRGLLAVGLAALIAALAYARKPGRADSSKSA